MPNYRDCDPWNPHKHIFGREERKRCERCGRKFPISELKKLKTEFWGDVIVCKKCYPEEKKHIDELTRERKQREKEDREHHKKMLRSDKGEILKCQSCGNSFFVHISESNPRCPQCGEGNYLSHVRDVTKRRR